MSKPIKEIRKAMFRIHDYATGKSTTPYMEIPANPNHDADLILSDAIDELEQARAQLAEAKEQLAKSQDSEQRFVDSSCYYRNLAIMRGARPDEMRDEYDRKLCEGGLVQSSEYDKEVEEIIGLWAGVERAKANLRRVAEAVRTVCATKVRNHEYMGLYTGIESSDHFLDHMYKEIVAIDLEEIIEEATKR